MDAISVLKRTLLLIFTTLLVAGSAIAQITVSSNSVMLNSSVCRHLLGVNLCYR